MFSSIVFPMRLTVPVHDFTLLSVEIFTCVPFVSVPTSKTGTEISSSNFLVFIKVCCGLKHVSYSYLYSLYVVIF